MPHVIDCEANGFKKSNRDLAVRGHISLEGFLMIVMILPLFVLNTVCRTRSLDISDEEESGGKSTFTE